MSDHSQRCFSQKRSRHALTGFIGPLIATCLVAGLMAGCSESPDDADADAAPEAPSQSAPAASNGTEGTDSGVETPTSDSTQGGDGSEITLNPLSESDLTEAALPGELGCQFVTADDAPLLMAMGNVGTSEAARGVVKVGDYVETVAAPGGFDGMLEGTAFNGKGKTVEVAVTGPASGDGESPPRPATLTYQRADGAEKTYDGQWQCGP